MNISKSFRSIAIMGFVSALALVWLSGCSGIKLVANYDENVSTGITSIQKKVESILTKIERKPSDPSQSYEAKDYEAIREELNVVRTHAAAWDKNEISIKMLYELGYLLLEKPPRPISVAEVETRKLDKIVAENSSVPLPNDTSFSIEKRHKMNDALAEEDIRDLRALLEVSFRSLLRFENLKKRNVDSQK